MTSSPQMLTKICVWPSEYFPCKVEVPPGIRSLGVIEHYYTAPPLRPLAALSIAPWPAARLFELCLFDARNKTAFRTEAEFSIFIFKISVICSSIIFQGINWMAPMITNHYLVKKCQKMTLPVRWGATENELFVDAPPKTNRLLRRPRKRTVCWRDTEN